MSEIEKASALVDEIETKRAQHIAKAEKLAVERDEIALGAFTTGGKSRSRLDEIHATLAKHGSELAAIDAALTAANRRVADLRQAEERAAARQREEEMRKLVSELAEVFPYIDKHLMAALKGLIALHDGIQKLHAAGVPFPTDIQFRQGVTEVIETWAQQLPRSWHNKLSDGLKFLAPHERKTAVQYWKRIEASLSNSISEVVNAPVSKAPAMQRSDARDRQEAAQAAREFMGGGA